MAAAALAVRGLGVRYPGATTEALRGVDLDVAPGEIHALIGQNGAGKSTLLHVLGGVVRPSRGEVFVRGLPFAPTGPADARHRGIALIHQELALAPHLDVEANVVLGIEPVRGPFLDRRRARARAQEVLAALGRADVPLGARVRDLPPPVRQLVEIARSVVLGADVLLLDEPTSSLSRQEIEPLFALLRRLRDQGKALVYISHALDECRALATRFTVLRDGEVAARGDLAATSDAQLVQAMVGRDVATMYPRGPRVPGDVVLRVDGLRLASSGSAAAAAGAEVSFTLRRGEILGIAGLVGAGRTELLRAVFGLDAARGGGVRVGALIGGATPASMWRQGVGFVSEDRKGEGLALRASLADNATWPRLDRVGWGPFVLGSRCRAAARALVQRLGIRCESVALPVRTLSGGNQQKVALGRLLFAGCDVFVLDEPTRGIDIAAKAEVYRLLDDLVTGAADPSRPPAAVLLVSSYLPELLWLCDRIAVMRRGRLGPARDASTLDEASLVAAATGSELW